MVLRGNEIGLRVGLSERPDPIELSVVEVRNALRCPRAFALGRARGQPIAFPISSSSLGALFHRIAERSARECESPPEPVMRLPVGAPREQVTRVFVVWVLDHLIGELKASTAATTMPGELDDLAEGLRGLAGSLSSLVEGTGQTPVEALRSLRVCAGRDLEAVLEGSNGVPVRLVGRAEEIFGSVEGVLGMVEFKLTDEAHQALDRAQIALYRVLLKQALNIDANPVLLRYNPRLLSTKLSPAEADALVERRILPLVEQMVGWCGRPETAPPTSRRDLCPACPVRATCAEVFPERLEARDNAPAGAARPVPDPDGKLVGSSASEPVTPTLYDVEGRVEADEIGKRILMELKRRGVGAMIKVPRVGARSVRIEVHCAGSRLAQLNRVAEDVEHQLSDAEVRFERKGSRRFFSAPRKVPRLVELNELLARRVEYLRDRPGRFVVGEREDGEVLDGDLSDGSSCHLLVGGQTGSGKSVLLRVLIGSLCHFHPPSAIRFTLVDPKRVTFGNFAASVAAHLSGPVVYDPEALLPVLQDLVAEMNGRYERMERCQAQNIDDYNALGKEPFARRVVVVDEFQDLIAEKVLRQPFLAAIKRLGAKARAAGIHLILATQRPDKNTVPGEIKANLCGRIALRVQEAVNSRIILDQAGAEHLLGRGDLLANIGHGVVRAQSPMA
jgi:DNA segregation ATPase FtsK/SpoIIIE, S-DNA-T family